MEQTDTFKSLEDIKVIESRRFVNRRILLLLLLSNFSLLSFGWEIFTYPGMQQSTGLGWVVLFVV